MGVPKQPYRIRTVHVVDNRLATGVAIFVTGQGALTGLTLVAPAGVMAIGWTVFGVAFGFVSFSIEAYKSRRHRWRE